MPTPVRFQTIAMFALLCTLTTHFSVAAPPPSPQSAIAAVDLPGRYPMGDSAAPVQIVIFADFQCGDCQALDSHLRSLTTSRKDIVISMRHFPLCVDCNTATSLNIHPNACRAALAAEAAGILGGPVGFSRMHDWLFAIGGQFDETTLAAQVQTLGLDAASFKKTMNDDATLQNIKSDIQTALAIGLHTTPMILINGEEVQNWKVAGTLDRACDAALSAKAAGKPATVLSPVERWAKEWSQQPLARGASENARRWVGAAKDAAKVEIVLFGDFQERGTAQADSWIRAIVQDRTDTRYSFRQFPADPSCNPSVPKRMHPLACQFAKTAEAVAMSGGDEAYWKAHDRIFQGLLNGKGQDFTDANLRDICTEFKLDYAKVNADRTTAATSDVIKNDIEAATAVKVAELPTIFVNGKRVGRFRGPGADDDATLKAIIEMASKP